MVSKSIARYVRVSPRKVRQVIDLVRGKDVVNALDILKHLNKGTTLYVERVVKSAISSAKKHKKLDEDKLYISKITADGGPMLKRYKAHAMGRAFMIRKRTTHITVELDVK